MLASRKGASSLVCVGFQFLLLLCFATIPSFFNAFQPGLCEFGVGAGIFGVAFTWASLLVCSALFRCTVLHAEGGWLTGCGLIQGLFIVIFSVDMWSFTCC